MHTVGILYEYLLIYAFTYAFAPNCLGVHAESQTQSMARLLIAACVIATVGGAAVDLSQSNFDDLIVKGGKNAIVRAEKFGPFLSSDVQVLV